MLFIRTLLAIWIVQWIFFLIASFFKTDKVTDLAYGMTFAGIVTWLFFSYWSSSVHWLLFLLVCIWWVRLAWYLFLRIIVMKKDDRFDWIRENKKSFGKFWLLQWVTIFLLLLPVIMIYTKNNLWLHRITIVWWMIWFSWILIETLADRQKFNFKRQNPTYRVDTWLRSKSRHPNYFGEMLVWWGVFIVCVPYLWWYEYVSIISPFMITWILLFVTWIPPLEAEWERKYGEIAEFQEWKNKTNQLFPR